MEPQVFENKFNNQWKLVFCHHLNRWKVFDYAQKSWEIADSDSFQQEFKNFQIKGLEKNGLL